MTTAAALIILATSALTAFLSGIFGMAGGLILMGVLVSLPSVSVAAAMVIHGVLQFAANGWRAFLLRRQIAWAPVGWYLLGALLAVIALLAVTWRPDKAGVLLLLGLTPLLVWLPKSRFDLDFRRRGHAVLAGGLVQALNTLAGVAGPLLDLFFVRTAMTRQEIVATKSVTQAIAHIVKIGFWSVPLVAGAQGAALPPAWFFAAAIPLAMAATWLGGRVLAAMSEVNFRQWVRGLVTAIGVVFLLRGLAESGLF